MESAKSNAPARGARFPSDEHDDGLDRGCIHALGANVRKTGAKDGIEGLAQSIHNHGLLE